jgi:hypothetical protein
MNVVGLPARGNIGQPQRLGKIARFFSKIVTDLLLNRSRVALAISRGRQGPFVAVRRT